MFQTRMKFSNFLHTNRILEEISFYLIRMVLQISKHIIIILDYTGMKKEEIFSPVEINVTWTCIQKRITFVFITLE